MAYTLKDFYDNLKNNHAIRWNPKLFLKCINANAKTPLILDEWQKDICDEIYEKLKAKNFEPNVNIYISIAGSRGCGKTVLMGYLELWGLIISWDRSSRFFLFSNTESQTKKVLLNKINRLIESLNLDCFLSFKGETSICNKVNKQNIITPQSWNIHNLSSVRGEHFDFAIRIFDEAPSIYDQLFHTLFSGLVGGININILAGNPILTHGFFYDSFNGGTGYDFYNKNVSSYDCSHIDTDSEHFKAHVDSIKRSDLSHNRLRVEVYGEFPKSGDNIFFSAFEVVEMDERLMPKPTGIMGVDISTGSSTDRSVISTKQNEGIYVRYLGFPNIDDLFYEVVKIIKIGNIKAIALDAVAIGSALMQKMLTAGINAKAIHGNKPSRDIACYNLRAELYKKLQEYCNNGGVIFVPFGEKDNIIRELRSVECEYLGDSNDNNLSSSKSSIRRSGKIIMKSKKKMGKSPDILDSITYTFSELLPIDIFDNVNDIFNPVCNIKYID